MQAGGGKLSVSGPVTREPVRVAFDYFKANPGDFTTEPVASNFGFHIIQLLARRETPLTADAFQQAKDVAFQQWLTKAREEEYTVETFDVWQARVPTEPNFVTAASCSSPPTTSTSTPILEPPWM